MRQPAGRQRLAARGSGRDLKLGGLWGGGVRPVYTRARIHASHLKLQTVGSLSFLARAVAVVQLWTTCAVDEPNVGVRGLAGGSLRHCGRRHLAYVLLGAAKSLLVSSASQASSASRDEGSGRWRRSAGCSAGRQAGVALHGGQGVSQGGHRCHGNVRLLLQAARFSAVHPAGPQDLQDAVAAARHRLYSRPGTGAGRTSRGASPDAVHHGGPGRRVCQAAVGTAMRQQREHGGVQQLRVYSRRAEAALQIKAMLGDK